MDLRSLKDIRWPRDREKVRGLQDELRKRLRITKLEKTPGLVAGVDAAFFGDRIISVASLFSLQDLTLVEEAHAVMGAAFPYIPGLLSFREGPAIAEALGKLKSRADLVIFDGQGIAHPKHMGIASFMGALLNIPSVGCAKSRLVGEYEEPGPKRGDRTPLVYKGAQVGAVLRTRDNVRPVFVSPGHLIDVEGSVEAVLAATKGFRLTEPVRRADAEARRIKRGMGG